LLLYTYIKKLCIIYLYVKHVGIWNTSNILYNCFKNEIIKINKKVIL
jgi:hypothetical protein